MGNILVYLDHNSTQISKAAKCSVTAANRMKEVWGKDNTIGLVMGDSLENVTEQAQSLDIDRLITVSNPDLKHYLSTSYASAISNLIDKHDIDTVVCAANTLGKDLIARLSGILDAGQASDIMAINDDGTLLRPMYAGNIIARVEILTPRKLVTVRATAFSPCSDSANKCEVIEEEVEFDSLGVEFVSFEGASSDRPELTDAEVVVSGGRALKSKEQFMEVLSPLADVLGAAIGASRAAVDAGYAPNDWQVGQTGKVVAPNLYIAVGISGAIQHVAGMKDSKVIVAINKDRDAPIFEIADYGIVGDLFEIVPKLVEEISKQKG